MRPQPELPQAGMKWKKLGIFSRRFELCREDQRFGSLEWQSVLGSQARGEILGSVWSFRRHGLLKAMVTLRRPGTEAAAGIFRYGWSGDGLLELEDGRRYQWKRLSFWGCRWVFLDHAGNEKVRFRLEGFLHGCATVELADERDGDVPILVLLGWYLRVLAEGDAAVVAA
ncbi:MAG TPA: hypothetical protein VFW45_12845 [Candidatus Polarisedimenticolia bacterium]|nr:hypothetical protein [Candidatus Polarisedimenticolia bacterium]